MHACTYAHTYTHTHALLSEHRCLKVHTCTYSSAHVHTTSETIPPYNCCNQALGHFELDLVDVEFTIPDCVYTVVGQCSVQQRAADVVLVSAVVPMLFPYTNTSVYNCRHLHHGLSQLSKSDT
eukprot:m.463992 g.463992  ORF g.463992 m.463992 type:complete len:123 (-) comp21613_c0_seq11:34-402(-)